MTQDLRPGIIAGSSQAVAVAAPDSGRSGGFAVRTGSSVSITDTGPGGARRAEPLRTTTMAHRQFDLPLPSYVTANTAGATDFDSFDPAAGRAWAIARERRGNADEFVSGNTSAAGE